MLHLTRTDEERDSNQVEKVTKSRWEKKERETEAYKQTDTHKAYKKLRERGRQTTNRYRERQRWTVRVTLKPKARER
jgi:hypothetical protein